MKNSFCRICRGRFNLKYPPAAVDTKSHVKIQIEETGEVSENICFDCEETLLGFHKSIEEDIEEEHIIVDDDEILYKNLEKRKQTHCKRTRVETIQIVSSDSEQDEPMLVPMKEVIIKVEKNCGKNKITPKKKTPFAAIKKVIKKEQCIKNKIFESMRCPVCSYLSGIELEMVFHIRLAHPQYTGNKLRIEQKEGDSALTRRMVFANYMDFFECKECGKIYDRYWVHRKHILSHDRKLFKNGFEDNVVSNNHISHEKESKDINFNISERLRIAKVCVSKERVLSLESSKDNKSVKNKNFLHSAVNSQTNKTANKRSQSQALSNATKKFKPQVLPSTINKSHLKGSSTTKNKNSQPQLPSSSNKKSKTTAPSIDKNKPQALSTLNKKLHPQSVPSSNRNPQVMPNSSKRSQSHAFLRKQQKLQARRERRRQKQLEKKLALSSKPKLAEIDSPTFKMPTQPAPRASSVTKQTYQLPRFYCKFCSLTFKQFIDLNNHILSHHPTTESSKKIGKCDTSVIVCKKCAKLFNNLRELNTHINNSHRRKAKPLEINGNDYEEVCCRTQDGNAKKNEIKCVQSASTVRPYKTALLCQYCGDLFADILTLRSHESVHIENDYVKRIYCTSFQPLLN